jgi:hypothetical protein
MESSMMNTQLNKELAETGKRSMGLFGRRALRKKKKPVQKLKENQDLWRWGQGRRGKQQKSGWS